MSVCRPKFFSDSEDDDDAATTKRKGGKRGNVTTATKTAEKKVSKTGVVFSSDSKEKNCMTNPNGKKEKKEGQRKGKKYGKAAASKSPKQIYKKDQIKEMAAAVRDKPHRKKDHCKYERLLCFFIIDLNIFKFSTILIDSILSTHISQNNVFHHLQT